MAACGGIFSLLLGLGSVWVGVTVYRADARRRALLTTSEAFGPLESLATMRLWLIAWLVMGLGWACGGVPTVRYVIGDSVDVPATAPLIDHVIWVSFAVGVCGGLALLLTWGVMYSTEEKRWRASQPVMDAADEDLLDSNSADGSLVSLRFTLQLLAASAPDQLAHVLPPQRGHVAIDMVEGYEQWASAVPTSRALTDEQAHALQALSAVFAAQDQAEHPTFWGDAALVADARWEQVRQLARAALVAVAWPVEVPPRQQDVGWEGIA